MCKSRFKCSFVNKDFWFVFKTIGDCFGLQNRATGWFVKPLNLSGSGERSARLKNHIMEVDFLPLLESPVLSSVSQSSSLRYDGQCDHCKQSSSEELPAQHGVLDCALTSAWLLGCSSWVVTRLKDTLRVSSNLIDPMAYSGEEEEECFSLTIMWEFATQLQTASWTSASRSIRNKFVILKSSCLVFCFSSLCRLVYDTCPIYLKYKNVSIKEC